MVNFLANPGIITNNNAQALQLESRRPIIRLQNSSHHTANPKKNGASNPPFLQPKLTL